MEVTYPADENLIVAIQQLFGNLFSAGLVPLCNLARHVHIREYYMRMDYVVLLTLCFVGGLFFSTFDAPLKRLMTETAAAHSDSPKHPPKDIQQQNHRPQSPIRSPV